MTLPPLARRTRRAIGAARADRSASVRAVGVALAALAAAPFAAASLTACGGGSSSSGAPRITREEALRRGKIDELKNHLAILEQQVEKNPLNYRGIVATCRQHQPEARQTGDAELERAFRELPDRAKVAFEAALESETQREIDQAQVLIRAEQGSRAEALLANLLQKIEGTPQESRVEDALVLARVAARGGKVYDSVIEPKLARFETAESWEHAHGLLESFLLVEGFRAHPRAKDVQAKLKEIEPKSAEQERARLGQGAIDWLPIFNGKKEDLQNLSHSDYTSTSVDGTTMVFQAKKNDVERLTFGEDEWGDLDVEIVFRVKEGRMHFLARGLSGDWSQVTYMRTMSAPARIRISIRGQVASYKVLGPSPEADTAQLKHASGPVQLLLEKDGVVEIQEIWAKVLSQVKLDDEE